LAKGGRNAIVSEKRGFGDASSWLAVAAAALTWALRDLVVLVAFAVLLAYGLLPIVKAVQSVRLPGRREMPRKLAAAMVMLALALVVTWSAAVAIPRLVAEAERLASVAPGAASSMIETLRTEAAGHGPNVPPVLDSIRDNAGDWMQRVAGALSGAVGAMFGGIARMITFALVPLLAFYLLADAVAVERSLLRFFSGQPRSTIVRLRGAVDRALRSYVRGQAMVCLVMGAIVGIGLAAIGHPAALLLAVLVGAAEIIPYVGFTLASIAIVIAGWTVSPLQGLAGLGVYIIVNWVIGTFVTPRLMARYLEMHPFVVTVSVLAGAQLMGPAGAVLALPAAAVLQAVTAELAQTPAADQDSSGLEPTQ
jgi:predicted PurR-regulated permease PerM